MLKYGLDWFKGCENDEEKEKVRQTLEVAEAAFVLLRNLIRVRETGIPAPSENDYARASEWSHLQAHRNGRLQEMNYLKKLVTPTDREE